MSQARAEKVVGILGGMGPEATVDLMQRLIRLTPAVDDINHIWVCSRQYSISRTRHRS
jgi:aspartate racemase